MATRTKPFRSDRKTASLYGVAPQKMPAMPSGCIPTLVRWSSAAKVCLSANIAGLASAHLPWAYYPQGQLCSCISVYYWFGSEAGTQQEAVRTVPAGCAPIQANRWRTKGNSSRTEATTPSMGPGMPEISKRGSWINVHHEGTTLGRATACPPAMNFLAYLNQEAPLWLDSANTPLGKCHVEIVRTNSDGTDP